MTPSRKRWRAITRTTNAASSWPCSKPCSLARSRGTVSSVLVQEINRRIDELHAAIDKEPYVFNRRFLLRVLSMGHSQFAEFIGARGPNTQINAACASATQGVALAEDWIHSGRCKPGNRHLSRRRHFRQLDRLDGRGLSCQWSGSHGRSRRGRGRSFRPPAPRHDCWHGCRGCRSGERRRRA